MAIDEARWRELLESGAPLDTILALMRDAGASRIESMFALVKWRDMKLADAKATVHLSAAWADLRESADQFHEELAKELEAMSLDPKPRDD